MDKLLSLACSLACCSVALLTVDNASAQGTIASFSKTSPNTKNALVELFTSDGCDACPPANKWLSEVVKTGDPKIVPVSMHVTYWNNLGWTDLASHQYFDLKQDFYTRLGLAKFSYTPAVFLSGAEWSGWRSHDLQKIAAINRQPAQLGIQLMADLADAKTVKIQIQISAMNNANAAKLAQSRQFVYLYEDGLIDAPKAGELRGVTLRHDHVVKSWAEATLGDLPHRTDLQLEIPMSTDRKKLGIVAFVQSRDGHEIFQVIDLPLRNE